MTIGLRFFWWLSLLLRRIQQNSQRWYLLEGTTRRFLWCWLLLMLFLTSLEVFHFIAFRCHPSPFCGLWLGFLHPFLYFQPSHRRVIRDTFILTFLGFSFLPRVLRFWVSVFYQRAFFYPTLLRLWLRWGQEHPIQDPPLCLPSQNCPFRRMHGFELFMFELQDHWFINCASESRNIEPKLNYWMCFACSKSYEKTIKTLLTRLDVLLKTASTSQQSYFKKTATQGAS